MKLTVEKCLLNWLV